MIFSPLIVGQPCSNKLTVDDNSFGLYFFMSNMLMVVLMYTT